MTEQQEADYIRSPYHCPYCNSRDILPLELDTESFTQTVQCAGCGKQWTEVYGVTDIEAKPS
jgi:transcription elongation factor Elf1